MKAKIFRAVALSAAAASMAASFLIFPTNSVPQAVAEPNTAAAAKAELDKVREKVAEIDSAYSASAQKLEDSKKVLETVSKEIDAQKAVVAKSKSSAAKIVLSNYQSAGLGPAVSLLTSSDDVSFLNQMATRQSVNSRANFQLQASQSEQSRLSNLEAESKLAQVSITEEAAKQKKLLEDYREQEEKLTRIYNRLSAQERSNLERLENDNARQREADVAAAERDKESEVISTVNDVVSAGRGSAAVSFATAQIGKRYIMGATGPNAYDCSGLMMKAYASIGVSIPRTSQAQFRSGTPVKASELRPGDLVFYYGGISHVGMYIGNGKVVHASNPRSGVKIAPLYSMPYMGARRYA